MSTLEGFARARQSIILLLLLAGGLVTILFELFISGHVEGAQRIGVAAAALGLVAVIMGLFAVGRLRLFVAGALIVISLAGLMGVLQHFANANDDRETRAPSVAYQNVRYETGLSRAPLAAPAQNEQFEGGERPEPPPPPFAPLSLTGLALMAAVVVLAKPDPEVKA